MKYCIGRTVHCISVYGVHEHKIISGVIHVFVIVLYQGRGSDEREVGSGPIFGSYGMRIPLSYLEKSSRLSGP
jgi:hypothetical protein